MKFCAKCNNAYVVVKIPISVTYNKGAYFKCNSCNNIEEIPINTNILCRTTGTTEVKSDYMTTRYKDMIHDYTVPHTRNYVCLNDKCITHNEHKLKDAIWFKPVSGKHNVIYVCTVCTSVW